MIEKHVEAKETDDREEPPILYRYISWTGEYQKRLLTENEVHFAKPEEFNGPFDCRLYFESSANAGKIRKWLKKPGNFHILEPLLH